MWNTLTILAAEKGNGFWLPADPLEVLWGSLSFVIVVAILYKFTKAPIADYFNGRVDGIKEKLDEAENARVAAETERDRVKAALADSEAEKARIIAEAEASAQEILAAAPERAVAAAAEVRDRGEADLATTRAQAQSDLSSELTRLSLGAAEKVVEASIDDATQQRLIDAYISQIGSQN